MRVLLISPYHGGSHASWADGLQQHSNNEVELLTLPDRFWKWRMHGGGATLARRFLRSARRPDLILATDMLDLTTFLALTRSVTGDLPTVLYMHENQLTYPLPADPDSGPMRRQKGERDHHYAFINYSSMLAADHVAFNSSFHHDAWFEELPRFLRHFPEHNELGSLDTLRAKSSVLPIGVDCGGPESPTPIPGQSPRSDDRLQVPAPATSPASPTRERVPQTPLLIWNQRWEYDKNPAQLLRALRQVAERGVTFRLAICGQVFGELPREFAEIEETFGDQLVHFGFAEAPVYRRLLEEAAVTVSTAAHEFFGIGVLEAMARRTFAVLPNRLSYPELLSGSEVSKPTRRACLYASHEELVEKLVWSLQNTEQARCMAAELARNARRFDWTTVAPLYDRLFDRVRGATVGGKSTTTES